MCYELYRIAEVNIRKTTVILREIYKAQHKTAPVPKLEQEQFFYEEVLKH